MRSTKADPSPSADARGRRRLPAEARVAVMLADAAEHFAAHGFSSPTREIAAALGVTQALIYRYFASKDDLIDRTLHAALGDVSAGLDRVEARLSRRRSRTRSGRGGRGRVNPCGRKSAGER